MAPWQYPYHLGIFGVYKLFEALTRYQPADQRLRRKGRLFVVGELPEELTSYRHAIACWLNVIESNDPDKEGVRPAYAFTGDIGLHIGLGSGREAITPKLRCVFCNMNNELVCTHGNYHSPSRMREFAIKRQQASMIYLCTERDHAPEGLTNPSQFLSRPERG